MKIQSKYQMRSVLILLVGFLMLTSCNKEGCTDPLAENYSSDATENDGSCVFPRDKFIGTFSVTETCNSGNQNYDILISNSAVGTNYININNIGGFGLNSNATVSGDNTSFDQTSVGVNFSGTGSISGSTLTISYVAQAGGVSDTCTMNCIKQ